MRAIEANHHGRIWRKSAGIVAASLLAMTVFGGTTLAAQPVWEVGHGTVYTPPGTPQLLSGASSSAVSAGKTAGFVEWLHNQTPSNISQLYYNATITPDVAFAGATAWAIKNSSETLVRSGICAPTTAWLCSFGALNSGQTVYVTLAYAIPSATADGTKETLTASFNATGTPPGKNQSHGDVRPDNDSILISKNGDAAGDFNFLKDAAFQVADSPVGGNNKQSTSLSIGTLQVGAAVFDSPSLPAAKCNTALVAEIVAQNPANSWFTCQQLTSLTSAIEVGNGKMFTDGSGAPLIKVIVSFKNAPSQFTGAHPFVYHYYVDASGGDHAELITETCPAGGPPTLPGPCLTVGNNLVTFWLAHNGGIRM
jgi:hypothetical protein